MARTHLFRDFVVGVVFLGSVAVVGYTTLWLEGMPWTRAQTLQVRFPTVDNLKRGEPVLLYGVQIGQVEAIEYTPDPSGNEKNVLVRLTLDHDLSGHLTRETRFVIRSAGPLGGRVLEIEPRGETAVSSLEAYEFEGHAEGDIFKQLAELLRTNKTRVEEILENLRRTTRDLEAGKGIFGFLLKDEEGRTQVREMVEDVRSFAGDLNSGSGLLSALVKDSDLKETAVQLVNELGTAVSSDGGPQGTVAMLLHDPEVKEDTRRVVSRAREIADELAVGEGLLPRIIRDPEMGEGAREIVANTRQASSDLQDVVGRVRSGDGVLGKLVSDQEAWNEVRRILALARESIEDLREQAPINTFANVLFAAF